MNKLQVTMKYNNFYTHQHETRLVLIKNRFLRNFGNVTSVRC